MTSLRTRLIITDSPLLRRRILIASEIKPQAYLGSLNDVLFQKQKGFELLDQAEGVARIAKVTYAGMPDYEHMSAGGGALEGMVTIAISSVFLSTPILISYVLEQARPATFAEMRERVAMEIEGVRRADRERAPWLPDAIRKAKSFEAIARMKRETLS